jgi:protein SCO1/2
MSVFKVNVAIILIGSLVLWFTTDGLQALTSEGARRLEITKLKPVMPNIALETMSGAYTKLKSENGHVTVVDFIYTTCPFICQVGGDNFARLQAEINESNLDNKVRIFSISFDPLKDNIEELSYYGKRHNADGKVWTIVRPKIEDLPRLLKAFGVVVIPDEEGGYVHNSAIHIIDQQGRLSSILDSNDVQGAVKTIKRTLQLRRVRQ